MQPESADLSTGPARFRILRSTTSIFCQKPKGENFHSFFPQFPQFQTVETVEKISGAKNKLVALLTHSQISLLPQRHEEVDRQSIIFIYQFLY